MCGQAVGTGGSVLIRVGIIVFDQVEELDFVGPYEVLSYSNKILPGATQVVLVAESNRIIKCFNGLKMIPDCTFADCPTLDVLVVPGGKGRIAEMKNPAMLEFVKRKAEEVRFLTSVCTGSFILAAAGLLNNRKATTHYLSLDEMRQIKGIETMSEKIVADGNIITAAGVSSGIDLGLYLLKVLFDQNMADEVSRRIEYAKY